MRILITRSPYERMLSAYMDKVVEHGQIFLAPPGVRKNSTFGEFVHAAIRDHRDPSRIHGVAMQGAEHYGPLTTFWREHPQLCDRCWLGFSNDTRILKLEQIDQWYGEVIRTLGWEDVVRDVRWDPSCARRSRLRSPGWNCNDTSSHCFYRPAGATCETALNGPASGAASALHMCERGAHGGHQHKGCEAMETHYTLELAGLVTKYARDDLVRFGYPEWHGDIRAAWY